LISFDRDGEDQDGSCCGSSCPYLHILAAQMIWSAALSHKLLVLQESLPLGPGSSHAVWLPYFAALMSLSFIITQILWLRVAHS